MKKISVLIVDNHAVVRTGYKAYLSLADKIGNIYEADCNEIACQQYINHPTDVVIMDLSMQGMADLESIRHLLSQDPLCKILVFSIHNEIVYAARSIKSGAKGYITKNSTPEKLVTAVCAIAKGQTYIDAEMAQQLAINMLTKESDESKIKSLSP